MISGVTILYSAFKTEKDRLSTNLKVTLEKISSFGKLAGDWHYGEGRGPKAENVALAEKIAKRLQLELFCKIDAFPGVWGEIQVTGYLQQYFFEINILSDTSIEFFVEDQNQQLILDFEGLEFEVLVAKIQFFKTQFLWKSFVYFPQTILTKTYPDSPASPSGIRLVQEEESPYSIGIAPNRIQETRVAISTRTINELALAPRFFGNSVQTNYQIIQD